MKMFILLSLLLSCALASVGNPRDVVGVYELSVQTINGFPFSVVQPTAPFLPKEWGFVFSFQRGGFLQMHLANALNPLGGRTYQGEWRVIKLDKTCIFVESSVINHSQDKLNGAGSNNTDTTNIERFFTLCKIYNNGTIECNILLSFFDIADPWTPIPTPFYLPGKNYGSTKHKGRKTTLDDVKQFFQQEAGNDLPSPDNF